MRSVDASGCPGVADRIDWERIRKLLREIVGDSTFEIWLEPLELIAIDPTGAFVIDAPPATSGWVREAFRAAVRSMRRAAIARTPLRG